MCVLHICSHDKCVEMVCSNRVTPPELGDKVRRCYPLKVKRMDMHWFRFTFSVVTPPRGDCCVSDET